MYHSSKYRQKGVALVVGLILLLVATLVTVLGMQGSQMQERMSSNQNNKAISFMAAEYGASHFIAEMEQNGFSPMSWSTDMNVSISGTSPTPVQDSFGFYWIEVVDPEENPIELNVFGVARESQAGQDLAFTQLNIALNIQRIPGGGGAGSGGAINLVGDMDEFQVPNSNALEVNGQGGPAVGVKRNSDRDLIETEIDGRGRLNNYVGGVAQINFDGLWEDPASIQSFVDAACTSADSRCSTDGTVPSGTVGRKNQASSLVPQMTVIRGDAEIEFKGNDTGSGILIVEGNLTTKGTPSWNGLVIVLGGQFNITGGGNGGIDGSLYVLNMDKTGSEWDFDPDGVRFASSGGGNAFFNYNCYKIADAIELLNQDAKDLWDNADGCDDSGSGSGSGTGSDPDQLRYSVARWTEVLN